ncbi:hypothetical protein pdam_00024867 [Pocillopora damicornis]|uniref:Uncharacterized protein n=1 Tax=Pocillopora damicornis TaxID=46731 RepID=A0A3M6U0Y2_POCDA|nr:hypothetical protein pdam_00024867 [Pocillopora damicornis]
MFDHTLIFSENFTPGKDFKEIVHGSLSTELRTFYVPDFKDFVIKKSIKSSEKESALTIIRSVYKPYIPYLVDAVFAVARPLHNMSEIHPISNLKKNSRNMSPLNE